MFSPDLPRNCTKLQKLINHIQHSEPAILEQALLAPSVLVIHGPRVARVHLRCRQHIGTDRLPILFADLITMYIQQHRQTQNRSHDAYDGGGESEVDNCVEDGHEKIDGVCGVSEASEASEYARESEGEDFVGDLEAGLEAQDQ